MLDAQQIVAVVTVPFFAKSPDSVLRSLEIVLQLAVGRVILVYDRKSEGKKYAEDVCKQKCAVFKKGGKSLVAKEVDTYDTTLRWRLGIVEALKASEVQAVLVFPGDIKNDPSAANLQGWRRMIEEASPASLILGDYKSKDWFKTRFDTLIGLEAIGALFPEFHPRVLSLGQSKIRTEFFVVGRQVYEHFEGALRHFWGTDPTPQLILSTLERDDLSIKPPIWLDDIDDDPGQRHLLGKIHQIVRYVAEMMIDRLISEMVKSPDLGDQIAISADVRDLIAEVNDRALKAIDAVQEKAIRHHKERGCTC